MTDADRCMVAAANLRKVIAGEMDLGKWNEAEEEFGKAHGWRSVATRGDPAGWLEADSYTDEWFRKGNVAFRAYY
eukprot:8872576-Alexandrium_andersonii.AAC.1